MTTDVIWSHRSEDEPPLRRMPIVALAVLAAVIGGLVLLATGDWYQRNREMDALLDATEASEAAMIGFQEESSRLVEIAPRVQNVPSEFADPYTLQVELRAAAARGAAEVVATADEVRDVAILPWHFALKMAQQRYLAHSEAWEAHLEEASADVGALNRPQPQINGTFHSADEAYLAALPPWALHDAPARVEEIFGE